VDIIIVPVTFPPDAPTHAVAVTGGVFVVVAGGVELVAGGVVVVGVVVVGAKCQTC